MIFLFDATVLVVGSACFLLGLLTLIVDGSLSHPAASPETPPTSFLFGAIMLGVEIE